MFQEGFGNSGGLDLASFLSGALPAAFGIILLVFVVLGLVLAYHWRKYSYSAPAAFLFQIIYWGVGGVLLAALGTAVITFNS